MAVPHFEESYRLIITAFSCFVQKKRAAALKPAAAGQDIAKAVYTLAPIVQIGTKDIDGQGENQYNIHS